MTRRQQEEQEYERSTPRKASRLRARRVIFDTFASVDENGEPCLDVKEADYSHDNHFTVTTIAKSLGIKRRDLFSLMLARNWLGPGKSVNAWTIKSGLMISRRFPISGNRYRSQGYLTKKGVSVLKNLWADMAEKFGY